MVDIRPRGRPGVKDGSQAGWNSGGRGMNKTDECRHPPIKRNRK